MSEADASEPSPTRRWSGTQDLPPVLIDENSRDHADGAGRGQSGDSPDRADRRPIRIPAFLVSTIFHTVVLILLAVVVRPAGTTVGRFLIARQSEPSPVVTLSPLEFPIERINQRIDQEHDNAAADVVAIALADQMLETQPLMTSLDPVESNPVPDAAADALAGGGRLGTGTLKLLATGGGLAGRSPEMRQELGERYGATAESEEAVERALRYLAAHQRRDGSWSFNLTRDPCGGRCRHSKKTDDTPTPPTAATGLALMAFLGAGHTHVGGGPYSENVRRGLYYLRGVATESEMGLDWQKGSMYGHGIALMAIAEAITMTAKKDIRSHEFYDMAAAGVAFTCGAQHTNGSWGYYPRSPGDLTLTGWQVQSLVAAKRNQIYPRTYTLPKASDFALSICGDGSYSFGYQGPPSEPTTTAVGLALMLYLGESPQHTPLGLALDNLAQRGPMLTNVYHDYYAALALHHARHCDWQAWNRKLRNHLVSTQEKSGHEEGSWHFDDRWGNIGGRLYTTAMCALTLEVYYRYLPLYGQPGEFPLD